MKNASKAFQLGFEICFSLIVPVLVGVYADKQLNSSPIGVLVGIAFGLCCVFLVLRNLIRS